MSVLKPKIMPFPALGLTFSHFSGNPHGTALRPLTLPRSKNSLERYPYCRDYSCPLLCPTITSSSTCPCCSTSCCVCPLGGDGHFFQHFGLPAPQQAQIPGL